MTSESKKTEWITEFFKTHPEIDPDYMIAGKTLFEILTMPNWKRQQQLYKKISLEEKEVIMRAMEVVRRAKISKNNAMKWPEHRARMTGPNNPMKQPEARAKISASKMDDKNPTKRPDVRTKLREAWTSERVAEQSAKQTERMKDPKNRTKISEAAIERWQCPKYRGKHTGENHPMWTGGVSSYCPAFNNRLKEHIRNLYNRNCTICGKSTLQNISKNGKRIGRLDIDHLDENKMQGCDDWRWRLTPLCHSCHSRMRKRKLPWHLLLQLLLINNKRHQTNFLFGDEKK